MRNAISYIKDHKQAFFLGSLLSILIGHLFFPNTAHKTMTILLVMSNMLFGLLLIGGRSKWVKYGFYSLLFLTTSRAIGEQFHYSFLADRTGELLIFIYFISISIILFSDLYYNKNLTPESIYVVFSGFILLSVAFGFILMFINNIYPNSLDGIESQARLPEYIYFSLITLMTIGYGDIAPAIEVSKSVVVFVSLIGHFYTVFITALIIGRLITNQTDHSSAKS